MLGSMAFSQDSQILALARVPGTIDLLTPDSGELLARLESPRTSNLYSLRFAPDGSQLFALEWDQQIQVWDLRRIHLELRTLGLDWTAPAPREQSTSLKPFQISVVGDGPN